MFSVKINAVNSKFQNLDFLNDIVSNKRVDNLINAIIKGGTLFKPLHLKLIDGSNEITFIENSIVLDHAEKTSEAIMKVNDQKYLLPNDNIELFLDFNNKNMIITIN